MNKCVLFYNIPDFEINVDFNFLELKYSKD